MVVIWTIYLVVTWIHNKNQRKSSLVARNSQEWLFVSPPPNATFEIGMFYFPVCVVWFCLSCTLVLRCGLKGAPFSGGSLLCSPTWGLPPALALAFWILCTHPSGCMRCPGCVRIPREEAALKSTQLQGFLLSYAFGTYRFLIFGSSVIHLEVYLNNFPNLLGAHFKV